MGDYLPFRRQAEKPFYKPVDEIIYAMLRIKPRLTLSYKSRVKVRLLSVHGKYWFWLL